jgi:curved DNA-binding protein CbpA
MNQSALPITDPYAVLGLDPGAEDEQIRAAYLAKLKQFPPDRSPAEFEQVRDAYELLRDRRRRTQHTLFSVNPEARLESLVDGVDNDRKFVGPGLWLAVLKER